MTLGNMMVRDVTLMRPTYTTDRYGNSVADWSDAATIELRGWLGRQSASEEHGTRVGAGVEQWTLVLDDVSESVATGDRVLVDAQTFEVDGPVLTAWTPRGPHHLEVTLRAVAG